MTKQVTLTFPVPDRIYQKAERMAQIEERPVINKDRPIMQREVAAYEAMHPELWQKYGNQYVAIYQGQVVDHDPDIMALVKRKRKQYAGQVVLIREVLPELPKPLMFRSPHFVRDQELATSKAI